MRNTILVLMVFVLIGCSDNFWTRSRTTKKANAYYLKAYRDGKFIFVHRGHVITAKCRVTLTWLNGDDKEGEPMTGPGECTYVTPEKIGTYYGDDLMLNYGSELHFCPWIGEKTTQTADILDIESEELEK